jgi:hypothetical protein
MLRSFIGWSGMSCYAMLTGGHRLFAGRSLRWGGDDCGASIDGFTCVMTTAIALENKQGRFATGSVWGCAGWCCFECADGPAVLCVSDLNTEFPSFSPGSAHAKSAAAAAQPAEAAHEKKSNVITDFLSR